MSRSQEFRTPPEEFKRGIEFKTSRRSTAGRAAQTESVEYSAAETPTSSGIDVSEYINTGDADGGNVRTTETRRSKAETSSRQNRTDARSSGVRSQSKSTAERAENASAGSYGTRSAAKASGSSGGSTGSSSGSGSSGSSGSSGNASLGSAGSSSSGTAYYGSSSGGSSGSGGPGGGMLHNTKYMLFAASASVITVSTAVAATGGDNIIAEVIGIEETTASETSGSLEEDINAALESEGLQYVEGETDPEGGILVEGETLEGELDPEAETLEGETLEGETIEGEELEGETIEG
ncbi:MAG: hypothetical protein Q4E57_10545, partial [Eubacteriales bacterium]|nr:hypothetical protein [Eubacteriales bacterium]